MKITKEQEEQLGDLWFVYGNYGKKHSVAGHKFIQGFLEYGEDRRDVPNKPSKELIKLIDNILG